MMRAHSELIMDVTEYSIDHDISSFEFTNQLSGIWDGYLYNTMLLTAMHYPADIYERVLDTYRIIDEWIEMSEVTT
jgi:hypothetical protein